MRCCLQEPNTHPIVADRPPESSFGWAEHLWRPGHLRLDLWPYFPPIVSNTVLGLELGTDPSLVNLSKLNNASRWSCTPLPVPCACPAACPYFSGGGYESAAVWPHRRSERWQKFVAGTGGCSVWPGLIKFLRWQATTLQDFPRMFAALLFDLPSSGICRLCPADRASLTTCQKLPRQRRAQEN